MPGERDKEALKASIKEATRKAEVRRRWRILGMKIKFGLGTQVMAVKRRNLKDADSFIDKESEVSLIRLVSISCIFM
jgi:hypothetical protein